MNAIPPVFAFGFLSPVMLGWLALAGVPILIHLWSRRQYRQTTWAAMEFLLAAVQRQSRRTRLEQWLLLLIRTALIVLLVLAVAQPYWNLPGMALHDSGFTHRTLVIDDSFSMFFKSADQSTFEKAKQSAAQIVENTPQGHAFTLVLMSSPPRVVVGKPSLEQREILREIDNLQPTDTSADLPGTLTLIQQVLHKAKQEQPRISRHEIYFITDLQRVTWLPQGTAATLAEFRRRSAALAETASIVVDRKSTRLNS